MIRDMEKKRTSFRLSKKSQHFLVELAKELSVSQTAVLEIAIYEKAKRHKVKDFYELDDGEELDSPS